jgi:hypothetical protein
MPVAPVEPVEPVEPADPVTPVAPVEPTEPVDPTRWLTLRQWACNGAWRTGVGIGTTAAHCGWALASGQGQSHNGGGQND